MCQVLRLKRKIRSSPGLQVDELTKKLTLHVISKDKWFKSQLYGLVSM